MKHYILLITLITFIFFGCASQMKPSGGPIDKEGPQLIELYPINHSIINLGLTTKIILEFDEIINPISVVNEINIQNFSDFNYKVQGNKIIITPISQWPDFNILKITINRGVSDMLSNSIPNPIQLFYFANHSNDDKIIQGRIINSFTDIFELGLYQIINNEYVLIEKLQSDSDGTFQFSYLKEGKYIVAAIQNRIEDLNKDIRVKNFGFITDDYIDLVKNDTSQILIKVDLPIEKFFIKSFQQINNHFGYLMLNNGVKYPFTIPLKDSIDIYHSKGDSLFTDLILQNRIEDYTTPKFKFFINDIIDTIAPVIDAHYFKNDKYHIVFNEPIQNPILYYDNDSIINNIKYNFINPFSIEFKPQLNSELKITNIQDLYNNQINDTLSILIESQVEEENYQGGSIYGQVSYQNMFPIIIKAEDFNSGSVYYSFIDSNKYFSFINIKPGFYKFTAYEILGDYDSTQYFSGYWPFKRAAKFGAYPKILEVRNLWDFKDMTIIVE